MAELKQDVSLPGTRGAPPGSPVQNAFTWLKQFFLAHPRPNIESERAAACGVLIALHLLHVMRGCGVLNAHGFHSSAVTLLRSMEDALDCFAAVTLVPGRAEVWEAGKLKASDAAKDWTSLVDWSSVQGYSLAEYRKFLRRDFNDYSHCTNALCIWNLRFLVKSVDANTEVRSGTLEPNWNNLVIDRNAHSIDVFGIAHLFEFLSVIVRAYSNYLSLNASTRTSLERILHDLENLLKEHTEHGCQNVQRPPEIAQLS